MLGYWQTGLFDLDEGFYGAIVAEMNRRGEWITPYYAGKPWFEKPILLYWIAKPLMAVFGDTVGPRLGSVLCSAGTLVIVQRFALKHFSLEAARLAPLILGSSLLFALPGQMMLTDGPLLLCLTGAWLSFYNSLADPVLRWQFGAWLGLSVLAKGPVGILLTIPLLAYTYSKIPESRTGFRKGWLGFAVALVLTVSSWYVPAYLVNREQFVQKFLIEQNLNRFTGGDAAHTWSNPASYLYFLPILALGSAPWWGFALKEPRTSGVTRFLFAWAVIVFLFFTLSGAKLIHYVMPCLPPIAILAAARLQLRSEFGMRLTAAMLAVTSLIAWIGFPLYYEASAQRLAHELIRSVPPGPETIVLYQIGKRERDLGTGSTQLRETSLPSLWMYARHPLKDVEDHRELAELDLPAYLFTRQNRVIGTEDWIRDSGINPILLSNPDLPLRLYRLENGL